MTHSMHRRGSRQSLSGDFVIITMSAHGINNVGSAAAKRTFYEICARHNPVNLGDPSRGNLAILGLDGLIKGANDLTICQAVYRDGDTVGAVLKDLDEANLGLSTAVTGLFDRVECCCAQAGLRPHTVEYSLGTWGKTEKIASGRELEVATMCGHAMVPAALVRHLVEQVRSGRNTAEEAADKMSRLCMCGVFNKARAAEIIGPMASG